MRFLTPAEIITLAAAIGLYIERWCSSARTVACGSVSWRAYAEVASICCAARSPWPRS
jgi:hypothetical protein